MRAPPVALLTPPIHSPPLQGTDANACTRKQQAFELDVLPIAVSAMSKHERWAAVQQGGCGVLFSITFGTDIPAGARKQAAVSAGALPAVIAAIAAHSRRPAVLQWGCRALLNICFGSDAAAMARKRAAADHGCLQIIASTMKANPAQKGIQMWGCRALLAIVVGPLPRTQQAGTQPGGLAAPPPRGLPGASSAHGSPATGPASRGTTSTPEAHNAGSGSGRSRRHSVA